MASDNLVKSVNPNYYSDKGYQVNCALCIMCYY